MVVGWGGGGLERQLGDGEIVNPLIKSPGQTKAFHGRIMGASEEKKRSRFEDRTVIKLLYLASQRPPPPTPKEPYTVLGGVLERSERHGFLCEQINHKRHGTDLLCALTSTLMSAHKKRICKSVTA